MSSRRAYGWLPDVPDQRDHRYAVARRRVPRRVDLRAKFPPITDQGSLGSCTGHAWGGEYEFVLDKLGLRQFTPSPLFIYFCERDLEGTIDWDAGAMIRTGAKALANAGTCSEDAWPYRVDRFADRPSKACYAEALEHQVLEYSRVPQTLAALRGCLADGFPIVFGFAVYESFESERVNRTGNVPLPRHREVMLGGHAVVLAGYDDAKRRFLFRNSYGTSWGADGYGTLPYGYVLDRDLADDFWTLRVVEG